MAETSVVNFSIQDTSPVPQGVHNRGPGFHCIQDTSPGPQGVHSRGVSTVYRTLHQVPKVSTIEGRGSTVYRTLHQVPKVSAIKGFHCIGPRMASKT